MGFVSRRTAEVFLDEVDDASVGALVGVVLVLAGVLAIGGCGGRVVVDHGEGGGNGSASGAAGFGGAPLGTTSGPSSEAASSSSAATTSSSSSNGSSSSSSSGTTGGGGGCPSCPDSGDACSTGTCSDGVTCDGTLLAPLGTACGHSGEKVCDGAGSCVDCNTAAECPAPYTSCDVWTCESHHCKYSPAPSGTACGPGATCNHLGSCRGCHSVADCPPPPICEIEECTSNHFCVTGTMADHTPCVAADGSAGVCIDFGCNECANNADCGAGRVCVHHACWTASCKNGVHDGGETDVDCGGPCPACKTGASCQVAADCRSNDCHLGACD